MLVKFRLPDVVAALVPAAFQRQEAILRQAIGAHGGYAYKMIGDAFQAAFATAPAALTAAVAAQHTLVAEAWGAIGPVRVRMALDCGVVEERGDDYVGPLLNRTARLLATGHSGQILLSAAAHELVWNQLPEGVSLRDLGIHQLKDITRPEHVFQVVASDLPCDFPPLKTKPSAAAPNRRGNLPPQPTPLLGRVRELAELARRLDEPHVRLITIIGPGGMGKTRLAVALAERLLTTERYLDGVYFVALAPLTAPEQIVPALAEALNQESQATVMSGATDEALELARRSHAIYEELGDPAGRAFGLARLGILQMWAGLYRETLRTVAASRALYEDLGDQLWVADDDNVLAYATMAVGDLEGAWAIACSAIARSRAVLGSDEPQALWVGGAIALMRGNLSEAARLLQASAELLEQWGLPGHAGRPRTWLATARWLGRQADAQTDLLALLRATLAHPDTISLLQTLLGIALIFAEEGAPERALELYALARQHPLIANNQAHTTFFGQRLDAASTALPPEAAQAAQARGRARDLWPTARELLAELEAAGWSAGVTEP